LLANFAAGAFMIILRPIKAGDFVTAGGDTGTVKEIGLFVTAINTLDKVLAIVGNGKIFADIIQNYSTNPYRRVDLKAQLNHSGSQPGHSALKGAAGENSQCKNGPRA
jgi:small conductance mechanosensitive channel